MESTQTPFLETRALEIWRGTRRLCQNINFRLQAGELLHLQGPNGSGKTSLLRALAGLAHAEAGQIYWRGQPIARQRYEYQQELAWLAHQNGLKDGLTPLENLEFMAGLWPQNPRLAPASLLADLGLSACRDLPCRQLSAGQKRRAALARVLLSPASLWLLDEPYTSLDSATSQYLDSVLVTQLAAGGLIVLSSHQPVRLTGRVPQVLTLGAEGQG